MAEKNDISIKISAQDAASPVFQRFLAQLQGVSGKTDEVNKKMGASFSQMAGGVAQMGAAFSTLTSGGLSGMVSGFTTLNAGIKNVTASFGGLSKHAQVATTIFAGIAAGAAALGGGMFALAKKAADAGDEMYTLSGRLGISVEKLSTMSIVAGAAGATTADLTTGLRILSQRLSQAQDPASEAARIFKILGINTKQTADEAFAALGDALHKLPSETDRVAAALALLGRGGQALLPMFEKGGRSIAEYQKLLREMRLEMSGKTAEAGDRMNDAFQLMNITFEAVVRKLGEGLVPKFAELAETLVRVFGNKQVMDGALKLGETMVSAFDAAARAAGFLLRHLHDLYAIMGVLGGAAAGLAVGGPVGALVGAGVGLSAVAGYNAYDAFTGRNNFPATGIPGVAGRRNNFPYPGTVAPPGGVSTVGGLSFEEQLAADKQRAEAAQAAAELKTKAETDRYFKVIKSRMVGSIFDTGPLPLPLRHTGTSFADPDRLWSTDATQQTAQSFMRRVIMGKTPGGGLGGDNPKITSNMKEFNKEMAQSWSLLNKSSAEFQGFTNSGRPVSDLLKELDADFINLDFDFGAIGWNPPSMALQDWRRFANAIKGFFRGQGGIFPSISAGFAQFKREASTLSEVTTGATVNMLRNFQTGLAGAYQNLIFGGDDEKARKRAIDALKDIRTEAASLALDVFGQQGELGTKEVSIIDTLFGMADQQGLPEGTKNRIAQLKVQMLSIETPQQQTAFGESITSMIDQLESQGGFLGRLKEFGKTMASNVSTSFQEGIAAMLAQATMDMLGLGRGGYTITFVGNFIDNVSREISHIGGKAIDITANLVGDAWDKVGIIANLTSKAVTFSFNALMEGNALLWESIFKIGDWAAEGGKAVINVGGNMLESYTRVMDSLGNFIDKTIKVAANVVRNPGDAWEKIQEFGNRIIRVGAIVVRGAGDAWDRVQEFGAKVISVSAVALQRTGDAWEKIQEFGSKIINIYSIAKERAGDAWEKIKEFGAKSFEVTANIAGIAWDRVREFSEKSFSVMATVAGDAWDKIKEFTPKDIKVLATAAGSAFERIGEFTQKTFNVIANVGNDPGEAWTRIREFTQKTFNVIANLTGDAWEKVKEFGPTTKEFFVKAKKYADSGLTDLWEGVKSFSGIKEFSVRAIKSGAGLAGDAWEGISKISGWVNDGVRIAAIVDKAGSLWDAVEKIPESLGKIFKMGSPEMTGVQGALEGAVVGAFVGAQIAAVFMPGHPQAQMIGSALGSLVGAAFASPAVGGVIGGLLGGVVDKLVFQGAKGKASAAMKELFIDIEAFGGVKGFFERIGGTAGIRGQYATAIRQGAGESETSEFEELLRTQFSLTKTQAEVLRLSLDNIARTGTMGISWQMTGQLIESMKRIGLSIQDIEKSLVVYNDAGGTGYRLDITGSGYNDWRATEAIMQGTVPIGADTGSSESPPSAAKPVGPVGQAQQLLRNALMAGNMKLSRGALRNLGWAGVVSQAINDVGMPWPQVGFALRSVTQGTSIPGDADERYIKDQTGVEIVARYGLGRVPGAEGVPMPAIVHGGEQILSAPQVRAGMGAGGDMSFNTTIVVQDTGGGATSARSQGDAIWRELEPRLEDFLRRKSRWGQLNYSERSLRTVLQ